MYPRIEYFAVLPRYSVEPLLSRLGLRPTKDNFFSTDKQGDGKKGVERRAFSAPTARPRLLARRCCLSSLNIAPSTHNHALRAYAAGGALFTRALGQ